MSEEDHESTKRRKRERRNHARKGRNSGKLETEENEGNKGKISAIALNQSDRFAALFVAFVIFCSTFFGLLAKRKPARTGRLFRVFALSCFRDSLASAPSAAGA